MPDLDLDEARKLVEAATREWGGDDCDECCGCGRTLYLSSPELERVGLCGECNERLVDVLSALIAEVERLRGSAP